MLASTPASHDRDRDTFRQSRKIAVNFAASKSTAVTHVDTGDYLGAQAGEPAKQVATWEAWRAQRRRTAGGRQSGATRRTRCKLHPPLARYC